jgi:hypothetical protein
LVENELSINCIGYDSSQGMLDKLIEDFPSYSENVFLQDITKPLNHQADAVLLSAVFIHLTIKEQHKILNNIYTIQPYKIAFDIDGLNKDDKRQKLKVFSSINKQNFRHTRQRPKKMLNRCKALFPNYDIETIPFLKGENYRKNVYVFLLTRKDNV